MSTEATASNSAPIAAPTAPQNHLAPAPPSALELAQQGIASLFKSTDVVELRVPKARNGKGTISGYFSDHAKLAEAIADLSGKHDGIYLTLNPCSPALLARAANRVKTRAQTTTSDADILKRNWLLIDIDPVRSAGISATDEEISYACGVTKSVYEYLQSLGWPTPTSAESGNGFHLLYNVDLPNSKGATELIKAVLKVLSEKFDTLQAKVDKSVFNAARIVKAYGSLAAKGDSTSDRPHRVARILKVGSGTVTLEQLQALAGELKTPEEKAPAGEYTGTSTEITAAKMEEFLECHGIQHVAGIEVREGQVKWVLECCPFNPEHKGKDAAVFLTDGVLGFKCLHNSCSENHWKEFRHKAEELSGQKFYFSESSSVVVGQPESIVEPDTVSETMPGIHKMPDAALDGLLGEICQKRMKIFPLDYAWPALVVAASTLVPSAPQDGIHIGRPVKPRANLFGCLIGNVHTGKSTALEQALLILGMQSGQKNSEFLLPVKAGSAEGLTAEIGDIAGGSRLLSPDELLHLLDKVSIAKSSFQSILNDAFSRDFQPNIQAKGKKVAFNCRLSIIGGLVEELFETAFGAATVGGLYDRFLFGHHIDDKPLLYENPTETPEDLNPCPVTIHPEVTELLHEWVTGGLNPRVAEIVIRVAHVCASFSGKPVLLAKDLGPAFALAKYQEAVRQRFAPNPGNNDVAHCAVSVERFLTKQHPAWVRRNKMYRAVHAEKYGPKVFEIAVDALVKSGRVRKGVDGNCQLLGLNIEIPESQLQKAGTTEDWKTFKVTFQSGKENA